jgi:ribosomal protein L37AE/L43A
MKHGDEINCPNCGKGTFIIKKAAMDGWTKIGDIFACSGCDAKIADVEDQKTTFEEKSSVASSAFAGFLGVEKEEKKELIATEDEKHFCRDCGNLVSHPFLTRCELHKKDVNPMDDCPDFIPKKKSKNGESVVGDQ